MARSAIAPGSPLWTGIRRVLLASFRGTAPFAVTPLPSALRAGRSRLRGLALQSNRAAARFEDLHQTCGQQQRLRILPDATDVLQIVQRSENACALPGREDHTHLYRVFLG